MPTPLKKMSFAKVRSSFFFGLIGVLLVAFLYLIRPFMLPLFWAATIAVMVFPVYKRLRQHTGLPGLSSFLSVLLVLSLIIVPLAIFAVLLVNQSIHLYQSIAAGPLFRFHELSTWLAGTPFAPFITQAQEVWGGYASNAAQGVSLFLFKNLRQVTQNSLMFAFLFFIMMYALYFFFKDGERFLQYIMRLSPLGNNHEKMLFNRFRSTAAATLKSTFVVGGVQGLLGAILFIATGVPGAFVWAVIMGMMSILPGAGAFAVWGPAGIIFLSIGRIWEGVTILVVGALLISTIDNFIRPPLVGKDTELHPLMVLLSTIGGILLFGISGFVLGPVLAALFFTVLSMYSDYYKQELNNGV